MNIQGKVAIITGAASGIGQATSTELVKRGIKAIGLVDRSEAVLEIARSFNDLRGGPVAEGLVGDVVDPTFRKTCYDLMQSKYGTPSICIPAAGITRDRLAVKMDKETGRADIYPLENFKLVIDVNLIAPVYWAIEMVARIAEDRARAGLKRWNPDEGVQGTIVFIGSVSSQGNAGQISYAATKAGLEGAASTLMQGGDLPRGARGGDPPRLHRHADGPGAGSGVPREVRPAVHAVATADQAGGDRRRDLFHDQQPRRQRRALGRRRVAPQRLIPKCSDYAISH